MTASPLLSVIIPVRDGAPFIGQAIDSVLAQAYRPLEIVVVDDGSADGSADVARAYGDPVRVIVQEAAGQAAARNRGVAEAEGSVLGFLDADDLWSAHRLPRQLDVLAAGRADMVSGGVEEFVEPGSKADGVVIPRSSALPAALPGCLLLPAETFHRVGWFSTEWRVGEFIDWVARARHLGFRIESIPEVVLHRRLHGANLGLQSADARQDLIRIVRAARRRREPGAPPQ